MSIALSISSFVIVNGGVSVMILPIVTLKFSPLASAAYITCSASSAAGSFVFRSLTSSKLHSHQQTQSSDGPDYLVLLHHLAHSVDGMNAHVLGIRQKTVVFQAFDRGQSRGAGYRILLVGVVTQSAIR